MIKIRGFYQEEEEDDYYYYEDNGPEYYDKVENFGSPNKYYKKTIIKLFGIPMLTIIKHEENE